MKEAIPSVLSFLAPTVLHDLSRARIRDIERKSRKITDVIVPAQRPIRDDL